jgi:hypothetical protein
VDVEPVPPCSSLRSDLSPLASWGDDTFLGGLKKLAHQIPC